MRLWIVKQTCACDSPPPSCPHPRLSWFHSLRTVWRFLLGKCGTSVGCIIYKLGETVVVNLFIWLRLLAAFCGLHLLLIVLCPNLWSSFVLVILVTCVLNWCRGILNVWFVLRCGWRDVKLQELTNPFQKWHGRRVTVADCSPTVTIPIPLSEYHSVKENVIYIIHKVTHTHTHARTPLPPTHGIFQFTQWVWLWVWGRCFGC